MATCWWPGTVIYPASLGYADASRARPLRPELLFDIGSVSKEFNGAAIMLLQQRGQLRLDDALSTYLPTLPAWAQRVKIRHLLNYTSGIPAARATADESDQDILNALLQLRELKFEPGTAYLYCHYNVYLQMRVVEKVTGLSYKEFITKNILRPCHLTHAVVAMPTRDPRMAQAFSNEFTPTAYEQKMTGWVRLPIADLYQWTRCLAQYKLLSAASISALAANFAAGESSLGYTSFAPDGRWLTHQHQGSNSNYEAVLYRDEPQAITIVLMTNNQNLKVQALKTAILRILNGEPFTVPKKSLYLDLREKMLADPEQGLAFYRLAKATQQARYDFTAEVPDLINTGKYLRRRDRLTDAISTFHLALLLPAKPTDAAYACELIAECCLQQGSQQQALLYYQQATRLDAGNENAQGMALMVEKALSSAK